MTGSWDKLIRIFSSEYGELLRDLKGQENDIYCLRMTEDEKRICVGGLKGELKVWELSSGTHISCVGGHNDQIL